MFDPELMICCKVLTIILHVYGFDLLADILFFVNLVVSVFTFKVAANFLLFICVAESQKYFSTSIYVVYNKLLQLLYHILFCLNVFF